MEIPEPIRHLLATWQEAHAAADAARLAALYAEDGWLLSPSGKVQGRAAIAAYFDAHLPGTPREQPRLAAPRFFFFPPLVHVTASATGRHGEKHSAVDILQRQDDGTYLYAGSSWTWRG